MTLAELQARLHLLYEGDTSTPDSSDDDYTTRTALLNAGIAVWEQEEDWRELYTTLSASAVGLGGDKTTVADQAAYDCPSDFSRLVGYLRVGTTYYNQISPHQVQLYDQDTTTDFFYVTGNPSTGYDVTIHPTPTTTGDTISYEYYKTASTLSSSSDVPEMSDPMFLVYFALSRLHEADGANYKAQKAQMEASTRLEMMVQKNNQVTWYQKGNIIDVDFSRGVGGFGV